MVPSLDFCSVSVSSQFCSCHDLSRALISPLTVSYEILQAGSGPIYGSASHFLASIPNIFSVSYSLVIAHHWSVFQYEKSFLTNYSPKWIPGCIVSVLPSFLLHSCMLVLGHNIINTYLKICVNIMV